MSLLQLVALGVLSLSLGYAYGAVENEPSVTPPERFAWLLLSTGSIATLFLSLALS